MTKLTPEDRENVAKALEMRANYIETGDVVLSRGDLTIRAGGSAAPGSRVAAAMRRLASIDEHQCKLILRLRELARQIRDTP